jgi:hypothetical protein
MDFFKTALDFLKESKDKKETQTVLTRFFLLECHHNRKVIAMMDWKSCTEQMKRSLVAEFKTDAARGVIGFVDRNLVQYLYSELKENEDKKSKSSRLISLITKIDAIQIIAKLDPDGQLKNNQFKQRVNNIEELLKDIINNVGDKYSITI